MERIFSIHASIRDLTYPNTRELAKRFECEPKTVQRDIAFLRDRMGLDLQYSRKHNGFHYATETGEVPVHLFSRESLLSLHLARRLKGHLRGTGFDHKLDQVIERLASDIRYVLGASQAEIDEVLSTATGALAETSPETFGTLFACALERREVEARYEGITSPEPERLRRLQPHHLSLRDGMWYLYALDPEKLAPTMQLFALTRLSQVRATERSFERSPAFRVQAMHENSLSAFADHGPLCQVRVRLEDWAARVATERRWHASQQVLPLEDGAVEMRFHLGGLYEITHWVLRWGEHATALEPPELVHRLRCIGAAFTAKYPV